jgi:transcriptional regulator with XRE-family HTH domain
MQRPRRQIQPTDLRERVIGAVLRESRAKAGRSQERLSNECGFDRTYISRVERGILNPTVSRLWRIADVLNISFSELARRMEAWIAEQERARQKQRDRNSR